MIHIHKTYSILLADPPWLYNRDWGNKSKNGGTPYGCMSLSDIAALGPLVSQIMEKDSVVLCWLTGPKIKEQIECIESWGFKYKTMAFIWLKKNANGSNYSGLGNFTNSNVEYVGLFRRGKCLPRLRKDIKQVIEATRGKHSSKPKELHDRVHKLWGSLPSIELFARDRVPLWDCLGNEISNLDIRDELQEIIDNKWVQR